MAVEHAAQQVATFEKSVHHVGPQAKLALANTVEQVFKDVGRFGQIGKTKRSGAAFNRVRCPKNGIELL